jgi:hypothetical protein
MELDCREAILYGMPQQVGVSVGCGDVDSVGEMVKQGPGETFGTEDLRWKSQKQKPRRPSIRPTNDVSDSWQKRKVPLPYFTLVV